MASSVLVGGVWYAVVAWYPGEGVEYYLGTDEVDGQIYLGWASSNDVAMLG